MTGDNGYVAIVSDEPIEGVPSVRLYGPFDTREDGLRHIERTLGDAHPHLTTGVLPLREPPQMKDER